MSWIYDLFFSTGITNSLLLLALTISTGILLSKKLKIKNISLGITWILFCGIFFSHFGMRLDPQIEMFAKDLGLILFVYSIGLQVGPGFFSSLSKGGLSLNMLAIAIVLSGCAITYAIHIITGTELSTMVGILSGAVTNTPGLGAAQQAYMDSANQACPDIATGYAVAYPLGVVGIILSIITLRGVFRINLGVEEENLKKDSEQGSAPVTVDIRVTNPETENISIGEIASLIKVDFIISRIFRPDGFTEVPHVDSIVKQGDILRIIAQKAVIRTLEISIGKRVYKNRDTEDATIGNLVSRRIAVTKPELNGKRIGELNIRSLYGVNITRINRAGIDLLATADLYLHLGDRVMVVGEESAVDHVAGIFGNSLKKLNVPNLLPIFIGIFLGILLGSIPFAIPGLSQSFKLGLAGGSLIIAIIMGRYGPFYKIVTFTTTSANMMIREIGISLFLAAVGLSSGGDFVSTVVGGGYMWILYGVIITVLPLMIVGVFARKRLGLDYFTLMGVLAGSTTDPPALAYAASISSNDRASIAYATVYPLTMLLRVMTAQILIILAI